MRRWIPLLLASVLACGQTVEESFTRDPGPLDLIRGEGNEQAIVQALCADALVGIDPQGRPVPRLALRWERRPGGLRFHLREAAFADGSPIGMEDVAWTFRQILADPEASPTKRAWLQGLSVSGAGRRVDLLSAKPEGRLLLELARVPIAKAGDASMGSGPYLLAKQGNTWLFRARPHFLQPGIPGFRFRLVSDRQGILHWLQKGWLSIGVPPARSDLHPPPSHREIVSPIHAQLVVWCKGPNAPLVWMQRWRRDAFPPGMLGCGASPSRGLWPESLGFPPVALAGEPSGTGSRRWELLHPAGDEYITRILLALRERARRDGVTLDLRPVDPQILYERLQKGEFHLACAMALFDPHPWAVLEYLEGKGPMNFTGWTHPRLGALLPKLWTSTAPAWNELQRLWAASAAALPILDYRAVVWVDRRLQVESSPLGLYLSTPGPAGWRWTR